MTTGNASNINQSGATLAGSYSGASATPYSLGFEYGTSQDNLSQTAYWNDVVTGQSGNYNVALTGLAANTTYYYRAVVQVGELDFYGDVKSFTTLEATLASADWLEMPAATTGANYYSESLKVGSARNYSYLYDKTKYTALWTAYPLYKSITEGTCSSSWRYNPNIQQQYQIDVRSNSYGTNYGNSNYSRGHQLPDADRNGNKDMKEQAYYVTNQTPQLQNGFNGTIWNNLEGSIRTIAQKSATDTVYVVTGAAFNKVGETKTINYLHSTTVTPTEVPIPNYYWKVVLKVKRNGSGVVTSASAVGVWLEHKAYGSSSDWQSNVTSVDQIEAWTGFDFFTNLPGDNISGIEATAEANTSWTTFSNF